MTVQDIRWKQRLHNYSKAFQSLTEAVELSQQRSLTALELQGLIQILESIGWARRYVVTLCVRHFFFEIMDNPALKEHISKIGIILYESDY